MNARACIISVGTELTAGLTVDTNSAALSRRLTELGIVTIAHATIDDHVGRISSAITAAAGEADVVVVTGGLGPTADDLTRQALAEAMGVQLVLDEGSLEQIGRFFRRRGRPMNDTNRLQAMLPAGAQVLENPVGTAPGIFARLGEALVFVLPGVPAEMRRMADLHVAPRVADLAGEGGIVVRTVHCFGAGESDIASKLSDLMSRSANPLVGTTAAGGVISVRIIARAAPRAEARRLAEQTVGTVRDRLGEAYVFGADDDTLAGVVGRMLRRRRATVSVAESCTGGLLGQMLTDTPGASEYFVGGVICYANRAKERLAGVPGCVLGTHGAVSEPTAEAMARGVQAQFDSTYGLAVTGIAGPGGGTEAKPVGLVYTALATASGVRVWRNIFPGDRQIVRLRSARTALNQLRLEVIGLRPDP